MSEPAPIGSIAHNWLTAAQRQDACEHCDNTETPAGWRRLPTGWHLTYLCAACGAVWETTREDN